MRARASRRPAPRGVRVGGPKRLPALGAQHLEFDQLAASWDGAGGEAATERDRLAIQQARAVDTDRARRLHVAITVGAMIVTLVAGAARAVAQVIDQKPLAPVLRMSLALTATDAE